MSLYMMSLSIIGMVLMIFDARDPVRALLAKVPGVSDGSKLRVLLFEFEGRVRRANKGLEDPDVEQMSLMRQAILILVEDLGKDNALTYLKRDDERELVLLADQGAFHQENARTYRSKAEFHEKQQKAYDDSFKEKQLETADRNYLELVEQESMGLTTEDPAEDTNES